MAVAIILGIIYVLAIIGCVMEFLTYKKSDPDVEVKVSEYSENDEKNSVWDDLSTLYYPV